mmetsp:Transcript_129909/g.277390  ORF Transcript_129909/g.277390 Transcript_129909/m.277390 type:complete len:248 (-) Transcript_129909:57-800(-)
MPLPPCPRLVDRLPCAAELGAGAAEESQPLGCGGAPSDEAASDDGGASSQMPLSGSGRLEEGELEEHRADPALREALGSLDEVVRRQPNISDFALEHFLAGSGRAPAPGQLDGGSPMHQAPMLSACAMDCGGGEGLSSPLGGGSGGPLLPLGGGGGGLGRGRVFSTDLLLAAVRAPPSPPPRPLLPPPPPWPQPPPPRNSARRRSPSMDAAAHAQSARAPVMPLMAMPVAPRRGGRPRDHTGLHTAR